MRIQLQSSLTLMLTCLVGMALAAPSLAAEPQPTDDANSVRVLNKLLGSELHNAEGVSLGELDDIAFDRAGTLKYAIVGTGGVLDIGEEHVAVPWQKLKIDWSEGAIAIESTRDQLQATPRLKKQGYQELDDPAWIAKFSDSYNLRGDIDLSEEEVKASVDPKFGIKIKAAQDQQALTYGKLRNVHLASDLIGNEVRSKDDQQVAEVEYLIANQQGTQLAFLIVGKDGFADLGETLIPVAWEAVQPKQLKDSVAIGLSITKQDLAKAPRVSSEFRNLLRPEFVKQVRSHSVGGADE